MGKVNLLPFVALMFTLVAVIAPVEAQDSSLPSTDFPARPSGITFVTTDLEASIAFYSKYMDYTLRARREIKNPAGLSVFGLPDTAVIEYANMVPAEYSEATRNFVHLNFAGIREAESEAYDESPSRVPVSGETVMAFSVTGLDETAKAMESDGVRIVVPLALSASGRSLAITVLDPNGVRIQLYEFLGT